MLIRSKQLMRVVLIGVLFLSFIALAGCKDKSEVKNDIPKASEVSEQKMCPIMDAPINKELFTEYNGKKVYFCCPGCKGVFEKDPEKYLDKLPQFK